MFSKDYYFEFFKPALADVCLQGVSDSKSPQVSRTFLSIPGDLNNAVVWMVSTHPLISKSSSPCTSPLVTVSSAPITIGFTVTFLLHSFFNSQARSRYLSLIFFVAFLQFYPVVSWKGKVHYLAGSLFFFLFLFCWLSLNLVVWPRLEDLFVSPC